MLNVYILMQRATTLFPTFICCATLWNSEISPFYFAACSSNSRCELGYGDVHPGCAVNSSWRLGPAPKDSTAFSRAIFNLYGSPSQVSSVCLWVSTWVEPGESDLIPNLKRAALQHRAWKTRLLPPKVDENIYQITRRSWGLHNTGNPKANKGLGSST